MYAPHGALTLGLNPIHPIRIGGGGGGGVSSTSRPVNCSELQNETSNNLETWSLFPNRHYQNLKFHKLR